MLGQLAEQQPVPGAKILSVKGLEVSFDGFKALRNLDFPWNMANFAFSSDPMGPVNNAPRCHLRKVKPSLGEVFFKDSIDLTKHQEHQIAQLGIGRKFQAPSVFSTLTVLKI